MQGIPIPIIAALIGALAGILIANLVQFAKWIINRVYLRKSLKRGLFFEVDNHIFQRLGPDKDGSPNMVIVSFNDHFFTQNLPTISDLLDTGTLQKLSFYYAKSRLALDFQKEIERLNAEIKELGTKNLLPDVEQEKQRRMHIGKHVESRSDYRDLLRTTVIPLENIKTQLLSELKKGFSTKQDPDQLSFVTVSKEYEEWWEKRKSLP